MDAELNGPCYYFERMVRESIAEGMEARERNRLRKNCPNVRRWWLEDLGKDLRDVGWNPIPDGVRVVAGTRDRREHGIFS